MADQVSVVTAATGAVTFYSTYAAARSAASAGDLIQIWADLSDEQILLKNGVDIWIAPGRIIQTDESMPIIIDNDGGYTSAVSVNITGYGIFKNINDKYGCVKISNSNSKVSIECISMENEGYDIESTDGATVKVVNASKFHLKCDRVYNSKQRAIYFENEVNDININVNSIESGYYDENFNGGDTITIKGSGVLDANEVISSSNGSCLWHQAGTLVANILKLTTLENGSESPNPTVRVSDGTGSQNLTLFFDEIQNLHSGGANAVNLSEGIGNLIGRRIYALEGLSMDLSANADILVDEIISDNQGINIHNSSTQKIIIDSNYIEGGSSNDGVVKSVAESNYVLRNAKIKCNDTSSNSVCIYLPDGDPNNQTIEVENIILVTGNTSSGYTIRRVGANTINIKNLGLFVNKEINRTIINLQIGTGTGTGENFKYIYSADIT